MAGSSGQAMNIYVHHLYIAGDLLCWSYEKPHSWKLYRGPSLGGGDTSAKSLVL
jgi:hypothetical protein